MVGYDDRVVTATITVRDNGDGTMLSTVAYDGGEDDGNGVNRTFVNTSKLTNRIPVTGGTDILIAGFLLALMAGMAFIGITQWRRSAR